MRTRDMKDLHVSVFIVAGNTKTYLSLNQLKQPDADELK